jgi:hypothetical protein
MRPNEAFGIGSGGSLEEIPTYDLVSAIQMIGGRGKCEWTFDDVSPAEALALLEGLRSAAGRVEDELRKAGIEPPAHDAEIS